MPVPEGGFAQTGMAQRRQAAVQTTSEPKKTGGKPNPSADLPGALAQSRLPGQVGPNRGRFPPDQLTWPDCLGIWGEALRVFSFFVPETRIISRILPDLMFGLWPNPGCWCGIHGRPGTVLIRRFVFIEKPICTNDIEFKPIRGTNDWQPVRGCQPHILNGPGRIPYEPHPPRYPCWRPSLRLASWHYLSAPRCQNHLPAAVRRPRSASTSSMPILSLSGREPRQSGWGEFTTGTLPTPSL